MCNQEVKFKLFLETCLADGADLIATGHYARVWHESGEHHVVADSSAPSPYHSYDSVRASSAPSAASPIRTSRKPNSLLQPMLKKIRPTSCTVSPKTRSSTR
ncbi:MAG: hypothetical protein WDN27_01185 [Candidatus Saccharibacteria bacterium]